MDVLLDRVFGRLEFSFRHEFAHFVIKVSQVKESFYVLGKNPRVNILGDNLKNLFDEVKYISENFWENIS